MATYKVPAVRMLNEFPMTPTGKIRKNILQQEVTNSGIDR